MAKKSRILGALLKRKKVVKPTAEEQKTITARLQRKYPQMYEPAMTAAERKVISRASPSDKKALVKMIGLRLKRNYKKK